MCWRTLIQNHFLCPAIDQPWWYTEEGSGCIRTASSSVTADLRRPAVDNPAAGVMWELGMVGLWPGPFTSTHFRDEASSVLSTLQGLTGDGEGADSHSLGDCGRLMSGWSSRNFTNLTPHSLDRLPEVCEVVGQIIQRSYEQLSLGYFWHSRLAYTFSKISALAIAYSGVQQYSR